MKTIRCILLLPVLLCSSCMIATKDFIATAGGSNAYKSATFGVVSDHNQSFRDAATLAGVGITAGQSVATARSNNALSAVQSNNAASIAKNASNNRTAEALGAQKAGVEIAKIPPSQ